MECSACGAPSGPEPLCPHHRRVLSTSPDMTPEQIRARRLAGRASLGLVDLFGVVHPLPSPAQIGRDPEICDLAILHASVSSRHAILSVEGQAITIEDQGSLNGTFVADQRIAGRTLVPSDAPVRFGAVSFIVSLDALWPSGAPAGGRTVPRVGSSPRCALLVRGVRWELSVATDGASLAGPPGEIALSLMEGRLLRLLLERTAEAGFAASAELVAAIGFGSRAADGENVRELVRRLRRKLAPHGLDDLIESRRNAGYRLSEHVTRA